ncbi:uncharacterized protein LOC107045145 [Diachasma alloeum]|uniref:uncharacterized protein LOC107045145 n=1 Tax=Diachasma alloeum TaxID=454923 RepID=UPI0007384EAE|nr:uncharacterized protein LOC107045145 [Diachasma alloeum]
MALDSMRVSGGRCPTSVVAVLLLICFLLTCNWWSLSTEKTELLLQIDQLHAEIKISLEEREKCETSVANLELRFKQSQDTIASLHVRENELRKSNDELTNSGAFCNSELESVRQLGSTKDAALAALRLDKDTIDEQLNVKREEAQKLHADLDKIKIELNNLNRTCSSKAAHIAQDPEPLANNLDSLVDDNNADTAGEIDDDPAVVVEPSKHQSLSQVNQDSVYNHIVKNSMVTQKSSKQ